MNELIAELERTKAERLALDRKAKELKRREDELTAALINEVRGTGFNLLELGTHILTTSYEEVPQVTDWEAFWPWVLQQEESLGLVERRPGKAAIRERWEAGVQVPGVEKSLVWKLKVTGVEHV